MWAGEIRPTRSSLPRTPESGFSGAASVHGGPASVLALQRAVGNAAVAREIASKRPQLQRASEYPCEVAFVSASEPARFLHHAIRVRNV